MALTHARPLRTGAVERSASLTYASNRSTRALFFTGSIHPGTQRIRDLGKPYEANRWQKFNTRSEHRIPTEMNPYSGWPGDLHLNFPDVFEQNLFLTPAIANDELVAIVKNFIHIDRFGCFYDSK
jgi:hypothetical protein